MIKVITLLSLVLFSCQFYEPDMPMATSAEVQVFVEASPLDSISPLDYPWLKGRVVLKKNLLANRISTPAGFHRVDEDSSSFLYWLRRLPLQKDGSSVRLYDGSLKGNQEVHHSVLNMDVGTRDLQQCADAVMRLRAEYLFWNGNNEDIHFNYTSGDEIGFNAWSQGQKPVVSGNAVRWRDCSSCNSTYPSFRQYLTSIFTYAGTASLSKELEAIPFSDIHGGDVLIQGGFPGHAVIVIDVCTDGRGKKAFLLAQSYMPAQEIHILKNPSNSDQSPWYFVEEIGNQIISPEWLFNKNDLKRFP